MDDLRFRANASILVLALISTPALCAAGPAFAASAAPGDQPGQTERPSNSDGEIVITAQRREERLQDVPISVTAVSGESLERVGVEGTRDLTRIAPGLNFQAIGGAFQPTIRGVTSTGSTAGDTPNVAVYVDGAYRPFQIANTFDLPDVERVEVLKGPQGTLFGRNAAGGAISVYTRNPTFENSGRIRASYGRFNERAGSIYLNAPLSKTVAANLSLGGSEDDGYRNDVLTGDDLAVVSTYTARGKLLFEPNEDLRVLLTVDYDHREDNTVLSGQPYFGKSVASTYGFFVPTDPNTAALSVDPYHRNNQGGAIVRVEYALPFADLTSITSYRKLKTRLFTDLDATPAYQAQAFLAWDVDTTTHEMVLTSRDTDRFSWVAGVFLFQDKQTYWQDTFTGTAAGNYQTANFSQHVDLEVETRSYAAFGEATFHFSDHLSAIGGVRYSRDEIEYWAMRTTTSATTTVSPEDSFSSVTPRFALKYEPNESINAYFSYSKGFKSGVFATSSLSTTAVRPEKVDAFEVGLKGRLNPDFLYNLAAFYIDHKDLQVQAATTTSINPILTNAAKVRTQGAEAEVIARPFENFRTRFALAYTDAEYDSFPGAQAFTPLPAGNNQQVIVDASGMKVVRTPKVSSILDLVYEIPTPQGGFEFALNAYYSSRIYYDVLNLVSQDPYTVLGARASWTDPSDSFRITLFGDNITDELYIASLQQSATVTTVNYQKPATYGVKLEYKWGE